MVKSTLDFSGYPRFMLVFILPHAYVVLNVPVCESLNW